MQGGQEERGCQVNNGGQLITLTPLTHNAISVLEQ